MTSSSSQERNLVEMLLARAAGTTTPAAQHKVNGSWREVGWKDVRAQVEGMSNGLVGWGVKPGDRVAVFAATSLTWCVADLAISAAQAICVPIYASNTPDEIRYILQNSGSVLLFVDHDLPDARQAGRLTRAREKLGETGCRQIVLFEGEGNGTTELSMDGLLAKGQGVTGFEERAHAIKGEDLCHLLYTSGTTGDPKGVMLSHGNWAFEAIGLRDMGHLLPVDSMMLFLPLAHSFAQVARAAWLSLGLKMVFAESVDKLLPNLAETRPTVLPAVPRVFEKVFASVHANAMSAPGVKGSLARWAFKLFDEYVEAREKGEPYDTLGWALAKRLVFSKVRATLNERLGGKMRLFVSGGAALPRKIAYFFDMLGIMVCEGYGLTETSAAATVNRPGNVKIGTVGPAFPTVELRIAEDGEVLIRGGNVMRGYWANESATNEVLEPDGWFHTGDIGELDKAGFLRITDRKKDLIKTSGGKYCAPQNLENLLKTHAIISNPMVHGDNRPYLTVLICVNEEVGRKLVAERGVTVGSYAELVKRPEVQQAVQQAVDAVNAVQPPYSTLKKFALMDHDFSQESGELTPTLKVKRKACTAKYLAVLDELYARGRE